MSRDLRLSQVDRGYVLPDVFPPSRVRMRVPRESSGADHTTSAPTNPGGNVDNLREARGIVYSALLGGALWLMIGFIAWLIAR